LLAYRILSVLVLAFYAPYALIRSLLGRRRIGNLRGRLGLEPYPDLDGGIWVHAVSVGEVGVARNLLAELARRAPDRRLGLSVTTAAGAQMAARAAEPGVAIFAFPLDLAGPVERALSGARPGLVLLTETEIWPLFLDRAARRGIPVALVNGRLSERSFARYRLVRSAFARVLERVSLFAMQTEEDAARIRTLGAPAERIRVTGNAKYDLPHPLPFADAARLSHAADGRPIFVAASTAPGEEALVLDAWESLPEKTRPFLAIAPRRPERFAPVAQLIERRGFAAVCRSESVGDSSPSDRAISRFPIYLLDTIGELASLYRQARLAFIGGSLVPAGGHNPIEAWAAGVPVLVGPHTSNFREVVAAGERSGILERVADPSALAASIARSLADPAALTARAERARSAVETGRGAVARTAELVLPLLARPPGEAASR
jgi:3-deoxy-D-manno-octulosonic-acid transferase